MSAVSLKRINSKKNPIPAINTHLDPDSVMAILIKADGNTLSRLASFHISDFRIPLTKYVTYPAASVDKLFVHHQLLGFMLSNPDSLYILIFIKNITKPRIISAIYYLVYFLLFRGIKQPL